jgi:hypothetical protein
MLPVGTKHPIRSQADKLDSRESPAFVFTAEWVHLIVVVKVVFHPSRSTYLPSARKLKVGGERQLYTRRPPTVASERTVPDFYFVSFLSHVVDSLYCTA